MFPEEAKKLKRAIAALVRAAVADSWSGAGYPEDRDILAEDLRRAKRRVRELISDYTEDVTVHRVTFSEGPDRPSDEDEFGCI